MLRTAVRLTDFLCANTCVFYVVYLTVHGQVYVMRQ